MTDAGLPEVQQSYRHGEFGRVIFRCDQLLGNSTRSNLRPAILLYKGLALLQADHAWQGEAIACFREGIQLAKKDRCTKAQLLVALGKVYSDSGDCAAFETQLLKEFEAIARDDQPEVQKWGAYFWHNYGTTLFNAFRFDEAALAFSKAVNLAHRFGQPEMEGRSAHDLGGSELERGHLREAAAAMAIADSLLPDETWGHKKRSRHAEYAHAIGNLSEAIRCIEDALSHPQIDDITRADVYYLWSHILLALGRPAEAKEKAMAALDFAVKGVYYPVIHKVHRLMHDHFGPRPRP